MILNSFSSRISGYPANETGYPAGYKKKAGYPTSRIPGTTLQCCLPPEGGKGGGQGKIREMRARHPDVLQLRHQFTVKAAHCVP